MSVFSPSPDPSPADSFPGMLPYIELASSPIYHAVVYTGASLACCLVACFGMVTFHTREWTETVLASPGYTEDGQLQGTYSMISGPAQTLTFTVQWRAVSKMPDIPKSVKIYKILLYRIQGEAFLLIGHGRADISTGHSNSYGNDDSHSVISDTIRMPELGPLGIMAWTLDTGEWCHVRVMCSHR